MWAPELIPQEDECVFYQGDADREDSRDLRASVIHLSSLSDGRTLKS